MVALRAACDAAVSRLLRADPDHVLLLGSGERPLRFRHRDHGSLAGYGGGPGAAGAPAGRGGRIPGEPVLPLPLALGSWLLERAGGHRSVRPVQVGPAGQLPPGWRPAGGRFAALVMGDGSARRGEHAPRPADARAEPHDAAVAVALGSGDAAALAALEPGLGAELLAAGVPAWRAAGQLVTGELAAGPLAAGPLVAGEPAAGVGAAGRRVHAELLYDEAPYGVGYLVACWEVRDG